VESHGLQHISRIDSKTHRRTSHRNRPSTGSEHTVEAIGTFCLVFTIRAAVGRHSALAPLAIGEAPMVMIYPGGHYNPAVTLAALIRHRIGVRDAVAHWLSQIGAGPTAALRCARSSGARSGSFDGGHRKCSASIPKVRKPFNSRCKQTSVQHHRLPAIGNVHLGGGAVIGEQVAALPLRGDVGVGH